MLRLTDIELQLDHAEADLPVSDHVARLRAGAPADC